MAAWGFPFHRNWWVWNWPGFNKLGAPGLNLFPVGAPEEAKSAARRS